MATTSLTVSLGMCSVLLMSSYTERNARKNQIRTGLEADKSVREIAADLGISHQAVYKHIKASERLKRSYRAWKKRQAEKVA